MNDNPLKYKVFLSSGYMAFSRHCAFLQGISELSLGVSSVTGTSSGAIVGALYCAGHSPEFILNEIASVNIFKSVSLWPLQRSGLFSLEPAKKYLRRYLPADFDSLAVTFSCGVVGKEKNHLLIDKGDLISAVCASFAVPGLFRPVEIAGIPGGPFQDGGVEDRIGLYDRMVTGDILTDEEYLLHIINKSHRASSQNNYDFMFDAYKNIRVFRSAAANTSLFGPKKYRYQYEFSLSRLKESLRNSVGKS
ncbi:hypothetical protein CDJ04_25630 [Salmonella enterica]|uniref:PNPLA domain-containing protein n=1 Tax=Salmonella enterica I TaxID=59201 RepID=A0A403QQ38_SALET|nr:hypothetical protein [Salmonella enterica]EBQ9005052.1 hypothetical protein [Salmonella enterica subsp. enterica serovar Blockley]EBQ9480379.1 hypothetical protein [Salmonella enterica subsp. enterica serovar Kokomlemle]EBZ5140016.1 hypothetical protein [Salmonella enterica subsp. enterica serovar Antsalova]ECD6162267.1 hypothetical protein [Salmonella enterica subsp. enterica]ECU7995150.1 hypothetical protein [Salmonella enterica subsp. enterica serovar Toucra]EHI8983827.1 hypothetical pr